MTRQQACCLSMNPYLQVPHGPPADLPPWHKLDSLGTCPVQDMSKGTTHEV